LVPLIKYGGGFWVFLGGGSGNENWAFNTKLICGYQNE